MSELEKLLEKVAQEQVAKFHHADSVEEAMREYEHIFAADVFDAVAVLRRKLLPLLEAGEAMREKYAPWDNCENPDCITCSVPKRWDAAKLAALKGV